MLKIRPLCFLLLSTVLCLDALSQGCSDAGFCTMGAMRPNQAYAKKLNLTLRSVEFTQYFGRTVFDLSKSNPPENFYDYFLSYILDVNIGISRRFSAQFKMPYNIVFGKLATNQGIGDISLSVSANLVSTEKFQINATLGGKIPTGIADPKTTTQDSTGASVVLPLPMYYSPTLGTFDFVAGVSLITKSWMFATGCQWALKTNGGGSEFLWGKWKNTTADEFNIINSYPRANNLQRGFDVMARVERNFRFSNWNVYVGLLPIWRINKDTFIDPTGKRVEADGSDGVATTLLFGGGYRLNTHSALKIMGGIRVTRRPHNPDGLSRDFVTTFGYEYRF